MLSRRLLLSTAATALCVSASESLAAKPQLDGGLRGTMDISGYGIAPGAAGDQARALTRLFADAVARRMPVFLPGGDYAVSTLTLPNGLVLRGVPGATRLVLIGRGALLKGEGLDRLTLSDITFDGTGRPASEGIEGLIDLRGVTTLTVENCTLQGAVKYGLYAERCGGRISGNAVSGAGQSGIYAVDSARLSITTNTVFDCGNGGILVHRWETGEDGTMVSNNRIYAIAARDGGTGENGNGINVFRAANVMVTDNHVSDCAFSAIRANAATNVLISGNQCLGCGETAIYSEFGFQGAIITGNIIDGAANGIIVCNFNEGGRLAVVSDNIVRNLKTEGPYIHDGAGFGFGIAVEADTTVTGNVIENAPKWGLMLGWGPYMRGVVATGNLVRGAGGGLYVTVVEGSGTALIANNTFQDVRDGAILGYRWNEKVTGDLNGGGADRFSHLTLAGNRRV